MLRKCLIVAGGTVSIPLLKKICGEEHFAYVFAVDRGLEALDACGICPTHLIGDFDSVSQDILRKYQSGRLSLERLIPEKDDTDTEHAMRRAVALCPDEIVLLGGFGTRFDHVLANVHTLILPLQAGISACMADETNRLRLLSGESGELHIKKKDAWGKYVSLLPLTSEVSGVTLTGFRYPLKDGVFKVGETISLGVSNEVDAEEGIIRTEAGILIVAESADQSPFAS